MFSLVFRHIPESEYTFVIVAVSGVKDTYDAPTIIDGTHSMVKAQLLLDKYSRPNRLSSAQSFSLSFRESHQVIINLDTETGQSLLKETYN